MDERDNRLESRIDALETSVGLRFAEQTATFNGRLVDLERWMTLRPGGISVAWIGAVSGLVNLL